MERLDDDKNTIEILSTNNDKIKQFGELLSNDTGRHILNLIYEQEMTAREISIKTEFSLELVRYHLQKMIEIGVVQVSKIGKSSKEQDMKYYRVAKTIVIVLPHQVSEKIKNDTTFMKKIRKVYRFATMIIVTISTWHITQNLKFIQSIISDSNNDYSDYGPADTLFGIQGDLWVSVIATTTVVFCTALAMNYKKLSNRLPF
ncbi:MAG: winged helix-turn-helix domain-containing protein [Candidatus Nitrosotenuis sp.]